LKLASTSASMISAAFTNLAHAANPRRRIASVPSSVDDSIDSNQAPGSGVFAPCASVSNVHSVELQCLLGFAEGDAEAQAESLLPERLPGYEG
jgi:uncharacterized protein (DUF2342 family)